MATDFVQVSHSCPLRDLEDQSKSASKIIDISHGETIQTREGSKVIDIYEGEPVKPGALPGVLVGKTKVWRDGKETVTEVEGLFPDGAVAAMSPTVDPREVDWKSRLWCMASTVTTFAGGMVAKFVLRGLNTTKVHGMDNLQSVLSREPGSPLLSVVNHHSCYDDPGIWGAILSPTLLADYRAMRWGASASEVIFFNRPMATFFALGKVVPIVRGWGVHQPAMKFLKDRLDEGGWVNIFPEGQVTTDLPPYTTKRYRWGLGSLIAEAKVSPVVLPVVHIGMSGVLPNPTTRAGKQPLVLRPGNLVTVNIGRPLVLDNEIREGEGEVERRERLTKEVQAMMEKLEMETRQMHVVNLNKWLTRWHYTRDVMPSILT